MLNRTRTREKEGRLDDAIAAFERAKEDFQDDRTIHRALGNIHYRLENYREALDSVLAVLAIDPEDRDAHYNRFLIYSAMGDEPAAAEAEKAFLKYKLDDKRQEWTTKYRLEHPEVNLESQPLHVHQLSPRVR